MKQAAQEGMQGISGFQGTGLRLLSSGSVVNRQAALHGSPPKSSADILFRNDTNLYPLATRIPYGTQYSNAPFKRDSALGDAAAPIFSLLSDFYAERSDGAWSPQMRRWSSVDQWPKPSMPLRTP